jgi:ADP-ribose pyrophosphatase YjhB (NUDIX family)
VISHDIGEGRFNLRAAAVIIRDGSVLVHRAETDDFWALPRGRVELFEPTPETLCREMKEEIDCTVCVERLLWIVENFFKYEDKPFHEIAFYHLVTIQDPAPERLMRPSFEGWEDIPRVRLLFHWISLDTLDDVPLYPSFLRTGLREIPKHTQYIVHHDTDE